MTKRPGYSKEVRERAVRLVLTSEHDHSSRWAATQSVAAKIGCTSETLRTWVNKIEVDSGVIPGVTTDQTRRTKELERENRELKRANEILRKAAVDSNGHCNRLIKILICIGTFDDETKAYIYSR